MIKFMLEKILIIMNKNIVKLYGEVMYPGTYSLLQNDETVYELINRAGGLKETADKIVSWKRFDKNKSNRVFKNNA